MVSQLHPNCTNSGDQSATINQATKQPSNQASNQTINQPTINRPNLPPLNIIGKKKMQIQQVNDNKFHLLLLKKKKKEIGTLLLYIQPTS